MPTPIFQPEWFDPIVYSVLLNAGLTLALIATGYAVVGLVKKLWNKAIRF